MFWFYFLFAGDISGQKVVYINYKISNIIFENQSTKTVNNLLMSLDGNIFSDIKEIDISQLKNKVKLPYERSFFCI